VWTLISRCVLGNDGHTIAGLLKEEGRLKTSNAGPMEVSPLVEVRNGENMNLAAGRIPYDYDVLRVGILGGHIVGVIFPGLGNF